MKDLKDTLAKSRSVALYTSMTMEDYYAVMEVRHLNYDERYQTLPAGQLREQTYDGYVRVTEPVEVRFNAINSDEVIAKAVESLNASEQKLLEEMNQKLADIRGRKAQLLALTHETQA